MQGLAVKIILFANTDWYLYNFRLSLARALQARGAEVVLLSPPGEYTPRLTAAGFRWLSFPLSRRGVNPFYELLTIWRLARLYRAERPQIIHHFTVKCVLYGSLAARLAGIRQVINAVTGLGYVFIGQSRGICLLRLLVKGLYRFALQGTRVIFQNPDDRSLFLELGLAAEQQSALIEGSGVDTDHFRPLDEPQGEPLVVLPARLLWDKGVAEFVAAAKSLRQNGLAARFALVGDTYRDNPAAVPPEQLRAWQQEGWVEWWGWQEDMREAYRQAAIVCLPSYREGIPRALVEAGACGRAVVASDVPGCRAVVLPGENGLLAAVRDPAALAGALHRLLKEPELRRRMGKRGREIVEARFSASQVIAQTLQIYDQMAASGES